MREIKTSSLWDSAVRRLLNDETASDLVKACYFDQPVVDAIQRYHNSPEWKAVQQYYPAERGRALDIGAGNGIASYAMLRDGWVVSATEPDDSELVGRGAIAAWCDELNLSMDVQDAFCEHLPFPDETFEFCFARQVMHHTQDLDLAFREIFRVLKPGGKLLTTRDHVVSSESQLLKFFDIHPLHRYYGGENAFRETVYTSSARDAGFVLERVLRSFDSPINLAPFSADDVIVKVSRLAARGLASELLVKAAKSLRVESWLFPIMSRCDRRPGRLMSLIATKPF